MTLKYTLWGHTKRKFGYEIRMDIIDGEETYHHVLHFDKEPDKETLNQIVQKRLVSTQAQIENPEPLPNPTYEDVLQILKDKGYLTENQTIDDLPEKEITLIGGKI